MLSFIAKICSIQDSIRLSLNTKSTYDSGSKTVELDDGHLSVLLYQSRLCHHAVGNHYYRF